MNPSQRSSLKSFDITVWTLVGDRTHPHPVLGSQHKAIQRKGSWVGPAQCPWPGGRESWAGVPAPPWPAGWPRASVPVLRVQAVAAFSQDGGRAGSRSAALPTFLFLVLLLILLLLILLFFQALQVLLATWVLLRTQLLQLVLQVGVAVHGGRMGCEQQPPPGGPARRHSTLHSPGRCEWRPPSHDTAPGRWPGMCRPPRHCGTHSGR